MTKREYTYLVKRRVRYGLFNFKVEKYKFKANVNSNFATFAMVIPRTTTNYFKVEMFVLCNSCKSVISTFNVIDKTEITEQTENTKSWTHSYRCPECNSEDWSKDSWFDKEMQHKYIPPTVHYHI